MTEQERRPLRVCHVAICLHIPEYILLFCSSSFIKEIKVRIFPPQFTITKLLFTIANIYTVINHNTWTVL